MNEIKSLFTITDTLHITTFFKLNYFQIKKKMNSRFTSYDHVVFKAIEYSKYEIK